MVVQRLTALLLYATAWPHWMMGDSTADAPPIVTALLIHGSALGCFSTSFRAQSKNSRPQPRAKQEMYDAIM